jgi:hypothetical protein
LKDPVFYRFFIETLLCPIFIPVASLALQLLCSRYITIRRRRKEIYVLAEKLFGGYL